MSRESEDAGLWFVAQTITEDALQRALRRLHAAVEGDEATRAALTTQGGEG